ncbi:hypothetical protein PG989_007919 [Apiospora arundinis]|uniref:Protein BNI4 n=1 Tax=Apiospora arundinis TaxID=335852 RepID=A0ABR2J534_9PEZI
MAAMVQTYPQQTGTVTVLQTRPSSSSGIMSAHAHSHSHSSQSGQQYAANTSQAPRGSYQGLAGVVGGQTSYRGSSGPVQPYAFTSTPNLANNNNQRQAYGGAIRTTSSPNAPTMQTLDPRVRYQTNTSMNNLTSSASVPVVTTQPVSRDDMSLPPIRRNVSPSAPRPQSTYLTGGPTFAQVAAAKASPERYRRPTPRHTESTPVIQQQQVQGSAIPSGSGMATVVHLYNPRAAGGGQQVVAPRTSASRPQSAYGSLMTGVAADDMQVHRHTSEEETKRFRRRSMASFDATDYPSPMTPQEFKQQQKRADELAALRMKSDKNQQFQQQQQSKTIVRNLTVPTIEKTPSHARNNSSESLVSSRSSNSRPSSSTNRNSNVSAPTTASPASTITSTDEKPTTSDQSKSVNIPPRGSSSDVGKRILNPSPLSKPVSMASGANADDAAAAAANTSTPAKPPGSSNGPPSAAARQLAAINEKGGRSKSKTSRLRRAFSFGSAAELRAASSGGDFDNGKQVPGQSDSTKLRKEPPTDDQYEEEQARIARKQEASGLGNSIYSGTKIFAGSTDNLSISSTASSASIMLRKMGKGVKKGGRSLVGLFRPKSMIGTPTSEVAPPEASQAAVSMITVEAERERVNINSNGDLDQTAGGTGFPRLERNSIDANHLDVTHSDSMKSDRLGSSGTDNSAARKSIVGGDKERAEVLATIRKGILKTRSNSPSPAQETKTPNFELPMIPHISDSPSSSAPSTPNDDQKRAGSAVAIGGEDYFMSALRLRQDTKSAPGTPSGGMSKRNATFSPRIVFYDTWPSQEYDRRGEIATCNRLTPMLAQQIKEELNSFKMEMEVHETSKIYTHFF